MTVIAFSVVSVVLETVEPVAARWGGTLRVFEVFSVVVFTVEYLLRVWSVAANPCFSRPVSGRIRWMLTPLAIVDLLAILPFYATVGRLDLRFLRALRLFRLFRVLKLARYSDSLALLGIGLFALPAGILASGFAEEMRRKGMDETDECPHCGRQIK